jgi:hypothetical protein
MTKGVVMKDMLLLLAIVVIWFVANRYILPRMGIQT